MNDHRDSSSIVPHFDEAFFLVDDDLNFVHRGVSLKIVRGVHKNLIKNFVKAWNYGDVFLDHLGFAFVKEPQRLLL